MIREIEVDGEVKTADHWFELGLPTCLHECLDGNRWLYDESRVFCNSEYPTDTVRALENIFLFPRIEDALNPLKLAFCDYCKQEEQVKRGEPIDIEQLRQEHFERLDELNLSQQDVDDLELNEEDKDLLEKSERLDYPAAYASEGNFLVLFFWIIYQALNPSPTLRLTQKKIDGHLDSAKQAVRVLKDSPLTHPIDADHIFVFLLDMLLEKKIKLMLQRDVRGKDLEKPFEALASFMTEIDKAGMSFSFGDMLDFWVARLASQQPVGVARPGSGDTAKRYFCVFLVDQLGPLTEKPIYSEVAILATAVFSDTSEDYVRKAYERTQT